MCPLMEAFVNWIKEGWPSAKDLSPVFEDTVLTEKGSD